MTIGGLRSILYWLARILGDANAVKRNRVGQRIINRLVGRTGGRILRRFYR